MPLPFDLPSLSRGFVALTPAALAAGSRAGEAAAGALSALLAREVSIRGRAVPGAPAPRAVAIRLALELPAVPARAVIEIEPALVVALVDVLAGGAGAGGGATALTPVETSALELFALAALDGACSVPDVEASLAPRLSRDAPDLPSALAVELELEAGAARGRGRLLVPAAAIAALGAGNEPAAPAAAIPIPASLRSGRASLAPDELAALAPGDVVLLDGPPQAHDALVLPGGARLTGRIEEDAFQVQEVTMTERTMDLAVTLEVELARVEVPLTELARLEPGAALPVAIDRRGLVTLRIGERAVGRGELVDVDGAVGVRVLSLEVAP